jgi:hypothetical protein
LSAATGENYSDDEGRWDCPLGVALFSVYRAAIGAAAVICSVLGAAWPSSARAADERPVDCELAVRGKSYIKGVCWFRAETGGGFQISGGDYFAQVSFVGPGKGEAHWNENPKSTHAQAPLGAVERQGACWVGAQATLCARELSPERARAAIAAQPGGLALFPVLPGASACLGVDGPVTAGAALMLRNCRLPADGLFTRGNDGRLGLAKHPTLCLGVGPAGESGPPPLVLEACRSDGAIWTLPSTASEGDAVRSSSGLCVVIPQLDQPDARFPFAVRAAPCGGEPVKFFLSKG